MLIPIYNVIDHMKPCSYYILFELSDQWINLNSFIKKFAKGFTWDIQMCVCVWVGGRCGQSKPRIGSVQKALKCFCVEGWK